MPNANYGHWGRSSGVAVMILRVPGIYAADRLPIERIRAGTPALRDADDAYTNHIHAEDLARIVLAALARGRSQRAYNASDGSWLKMGEYFDLVAGSFGLPLPARVSRQEAEAQMPETLLSFMRESRRLSNRRLAPGTALSPALSDSGPGNRRSSTPTSSPGLTRRASRCRLAIGDIGQAGNYVY